MPHINLLSPHVADLIAAGEVVERPASVIKELMENAFDAGADQVTVEIRDGGATMIRVTDNGCGMAPEDAGIAFLRHATSKLADEHGLEAITTMGFRGEALAAISAVSRIELLTRRPEDAEGTRMTLEAGDIQEMEAVGCPSGTSICIRDLFYNTPARLKFLKSDRSEASACVQAGLRCALGRPDVSVRFLRDGKEEFFTPGDGRPDACVYALLGRDLASAFLPLCSSDGDVRLSGFVSSPAAGRGNRSAQFFYCNGRFIRSALLQSALEQAYKNTLLTGRYPACVIWLEIRPGAVDVNVHPAKTEVKFSEERRLFGLLCQAVRDTLAEEDRTAVPAGDAPRRAEELPAVQRRDSFRPEEITPENPPAGTLPRTSADPPGQQSLPSQESGLPRFPNRGAAAYPPALLTDSEPESVVQQSLFSSVAEYRTVTAPSPAFSKAGQEDGGEGAVENPVQNVDNPPIPDHKILGEAFKTYIAVEEGDRLVLIDKHAAHERMNFDRLKARSQPVPAQQLLTPRTLRLSAGDMALLEDFGELFVDFGFELEPFGEQAVILRAVPADILPDDAVPALEEILQHLHEGGTPDPLSARDEMNHTVACKAAIKAGWNTGREELEAIVCEVLSGRVKYCPHGRPVAVTVSRKDLEKLFLRIV
ncbi:MAG: DNA mismatch repair endonuclease MutL [Oscillospiraceae bacterium]|nr:DNA mismatch repair endonuclease MutL [Oscillospiraceae bacterium]